MQLCVFIVFKKANYLSNLSQCILFYNINNTVHAVQQNVKFCLCLINYHTVKTCGGTEL